MKNPVEKQLFQRLLCMCGGCARLPLSNCICHWAEDMRAKIREELSAGVSVAKIQDDYRNEHGARSIATRAETKPQPQDQWLNAVRERRGKPRTYVAQANKTARIAWAIMTKGEVYKAPSAKADETVAEAA